MRAFPVVLPSMVRYWTVLDENLQPVAAVDVFLRHLRLGRDRSELTTRAYAGSLALFCAGAAGPAGIGRPGWRIWVCS
jgi:hypothetical protein